MLPQVHGALRDVFSVLDETEREGMMDVLGRIQRRLIELQGVEVGGRQERRISPVKQIAARTAADGQEPSR